MFSAEQGGGRVIHTDKQGSKVYGVHLDEGGRFG